MNVNELATSQSGVNKIWWSQYHANSRSKPYQETPYCVWPSAHWPESSRVRLCQQSSVLQSNVDVVSAYISSPWHPVGSRYTMGNIWVNILHDMLGVSLPPGCLVIDTFLIPPGPGGSQSCQGLDDFNSKIFQFLENMKHVVFIRQDQTSLFFLSCSVKYRNQVRGDIK